MSWVVCHCDWRREGKRKVRRGDPCARCKEKLAHPTTRRGPAYHVRFKPFRSWQFSEAEAKEYGMKRDGAATYVETEAQLNNWLRGERAKGRDVGWRDLDYSEHGVTPP